ncbi:hypothetical protein Bpfe_026236, partial [Biomphalaria pfeifferi]
CQFFVTLVTAVITAVSHLSILCYTRNSRDHSRVPSVNFRPFVIALTTAMIPES